MALPPNLAHLRTLLIQEATETLLPQINTQLRDELEQLNSALTSEAVSGIVLRHGHRTEPAGTSCPCCGRPFPIEGSSATSE